MDDHPNEIIQIKMPATYWVAQTAILSDYIERAVKPRIEEIRLQAITVGSLPQVEVTALTAPMISLLKIVDVLHKAGYIKDDAMHKFEWMLEMLKSHSAFASSEWQVYKP